MCSQRSSARAKSALGSSLLLRTLFLFVLFLPWDFFDVEVGENAALCGPSFHCQGSADVRTALENFWVNWLVQKQPLVAPAVNDDLLVI